MLNRGNGWASTICAWRISFTSPKTMTTLETSPSYSLISTFQAFRDSCSSGITICTTRITEDTREIWITCRKSNSASAEGDLTILETSHPHGEAVKLRDQIQIITQHGVSSSWKRGDFVTVVSVTQNQTPSWALASSQRRERTIYEENYCSNL